MFLTDYKTTTASLSLKQTKCPMESTQAHIMFQPGDPYERRDIRIQRRDNAMQIIQDNHRSYDSLQYPLIFWEGDDGYHINIKQRNPITGRELNKKVSVMNFYVFRLMIRANEDNDILRRRQLFHQYIVDMYVKIESERLRYIKFNQENFEVYSCTLYNTFLDACRELRLLEDDNHCDLILANAALTSFSIINSSTIFDNINTRCFFPSEASALWNKYKDSMSEDILHQTKITNQNLNIEFSAGIYKKVEIFKLRTRVQDN